MKIKITLTEEMLGTASANAEIHREFIASKALAKFALSKSIQSLKK